MLKLMQEITKQMEKALFPQCVQCVQGVRDSRVSLWYRSCLGNSFPRCSEQRPSGFIPVITLLTNCCSAVTLGTELE